MFTTAYDTLACRFHDQAAITRGLDQARVENTLEPVTTPYQRQRVKHLYRLGLDDDLTPAFTQPFRYVGLEHDQPAYVLDGRLFFKHTRSSTDQLINADEYSQQIKRAVLTYHWDQSSPIDLLQTGDLAPLVFCRWISETLTKRFGLSPIEQSRAMVISFAYWQSLFRSLEHTALGEKDHMKLAQKMSQISAIPASLSVDVLSALPPLSDITTYVEAIKEHTHSVRLEKLTPAFLYSMLGGSWFGLNNKETVAVSLEHPPTFLSLIDAALTSRNYRQSVIGRLVFDLDKKERGRIFQKILQHTLSLYFEAD